jgi:hypothetical protein
MEDVAKILVNKWKTIIESICIGYFSKKVESIDLFRMDNYYAGYPEIEYCYKVTFNFKLIHVFDEEPNYNMRYYLNIKLEDKFKSIFDDNDCLIDEHQSYVFASDKVDYMTNQGYRFIIQFYPEGFISELRDDKLKELGI